MFQIRRFHIKLLIAADHAGGAAQARWPDRSLWASGGPVLQIGRFHYKFLIAADHAGGTTDREQKRPQWSSGGTMLQVRRFHNKFVIACLLYTSPRPRDRG